jgi:hypothetical protein
MNIFILDADIKRCDEYHCDQHVVKMILESVQILCTALYKHGFSTPYKPTHKKHPCVLWAEDSYDNFIWLKKLALALNEEYKYRFERSNDHKSIAVLNEISGFRYKNEGFLSLLRQCRINIRWKETLFWHIENFISKIKCILPDGQKGPCHTG